MLKISKGVILCGGLGTRLRPLTLVTNKHLLPVYDQIMVIYPLETLKTLGIKDILIVSGGENIGSFTEFLGDGSGYGVNLTYKVQKESGGIAEALGLAKDFIGDETFAVILGDNLFDNKKLKGLGFFPEERACIFLKEVPDPERFGVPVFSEDYSTTRETGETFRIIKIEEKPKKPKNKYAVTGLYFYPSEVFDVISTLKKSERGELEITDVNNYFIEKETLDFKILDSFWCDCGTFDSLLSSSTWAKDNSKLDK